jgi:hypothetical protein
MGSPLNPINSSQFNVYVSAAVLATDLTYGASVHSPRVRQMSKNNLPIILFKASTHTPHR